MCCTLSLQVVRELGKGSNLRTAVLVGGDAIARMLHSVTHSVTGVTVTGVTVTGVTVTGVTAGGAGAGQGQSSGIPSHHTATVLARLLQSLSLAVAACRWCVSWANAADRRSTTLSLCSPACFNHCHWLSLHAGGA
jgi:hypothetical protein